MKTLYVLFALCAAVFFADKIVNDVEEYRVTVVQINAKWNDANTRKDLENLKNCNYKFGWLEDQPESIQRNVKTVPVVVIYKGDTPAYQYAADISLSLSIPLEEIQEKVSELK